MGASISVLNNNYEYQNTFGYLTCEDIEAISQAASVLQLKCLNFIYFVGDTYFNKKQVQQIKLEITILRNLSDFALKQSLDIVENAINKILNQNEGYLLFLGD